MHFVPGDSGGVGGVVAPEAEEPSAGSKMMHDMGLAEVSDQLKGGEV